MSSESLLACAAEKPKPCRESLVSKGMPTRKLEITAISAEGLLEGRKPVKKNAFVAFEIAGNHCSGAIRTRIDEVGGDYPVWEDKLETEFALPEEKNKESFMYVGVYCQVSGKDKHVGTARVPIKDFTGGYAPEGFLHCLSYRLWDEYGKRNGIVNFSARIVKAGSSKIGAFAGLDQHYARCYWEFSKARLRYKVGRIEQLETSDQAKARGANTIIPRKLVQVLTPSTASEGNLGPDPVHLLAIKEVKMELEKCSTVQKWPELWPKRLVSVKPQSVSADTKTSKKDTEKWSEIVSDVYLERLAVNWSSVRNVMDMNAGFGGQLGSDSESRVNGSSCVERIEFVNPLYTLSHSLYKERYISSVVPQAESVSAHSLSLQFPTTQEVSLLLLHSDIFLHISLTSDSNFSTSPSS
ncbi:hypothetical protein IGI04_032867 [Brassica rapa subsp. trilocularis]|uniref:C2 domain-containing protein n=1 Tax=Brassica rapa subsp. trilocularis TaxID=1813537 RepID=A0ABQ7L498_BRACM|nr:hypothetical protein IGI04_032867 [Brassica rapa subsp. trilocularis]